MEHKELFSKPNGATWTRLILCACAATVLLSVVKDLPEDACPELWRKLFPSEKGEAWKTVALLTAVLYGLSLLLFPVQETMEGYTPCP